MLLCSDLLSLIMQHVVVRGNDLVWHRLCHIFQRQSAVRNTMLYMARPAIFVIITEKDREPSTDEDGNLLTHQWRTGTIWHRESVRTHIIIDWGDGSVCRYHYGDVDVYTCEHVYSTPGSYCVRIWSGEKSPNVGLIHLGVGNANARGNNTITCIQHMVSLGNIGVRSLRGLCAFTHHRVTFASRIDMSNVQDMSFMFYNAAYFDDASIRHWDTKQVRDMSFMFYNCEEFNQCIDDWDTANVTHMNYMFAGARRFNQPLAKWNTSQVRTMSHMFHHASRFNKPIGTWDTSQVLDMEDMFSDAISFNQPIGHWQTRCVVSMRGMFRSAHSFNQPIGQWNTSSVRNMGQMFAYARAFDQAIDQWNISSVQNMTNMFSGTSAFIDGKWRDGNRHKIVFASAVPTQ